MSSTHAPAARSGTKARMRTERIHQEIRRRICLLDYPAGHVLREHDLARSFGVSRSPIRRVLHWLERDGLVESRQGVGTTVTTIDLQDLLDTYALRANLAESIGVTRIVSPTHDVVARLEQLNCECDRLKGGMDIRRFGEINIALHELILSLVGCTALRETSDYLFYQSTRLWFSLLDEHNWRRELEDMQQESLDIADAMRRGDYAAVGIIRRCRISGVTLRLRARLSDTAHRGIPLSSRDPSRQSIGQSCDDLPTTV